MMNSFFKFFALTVGVSLLVGLVAMVIIQIGGQNSAEGLAGISHFLEQQKLIFTAFRLSIIILVFWKWEQLIQWFASKKNWDQDMIQLMIDLKWKILAWILLFEIVVNQNLLGYLLN